MNNKFLDAFTTVEQLQSFLDWEKGLREQIAKEIEAKEMSIVTIEDSDLIKTHPDCYKCGTPAQVENCRSFNQQNFRFIKKIFPLLLEAKTTDATQQK